MQSLRRERANLKYKNLLSSEIALDIVHQLLLIDSLENISNSSVEMENYHVIYILNSSSSHILNSSSYLASLYFFRKRKKTFQR